MAKVNVSVVQPPNQPHRVVCLEASDEAGIVHCTLVLNPDDAATVGRAMVKSAAEARIGIVIADSLPKVVKQ
jgi:hypothetical protein